jgi:hypothetical protein
MFRKKVKVNTIATKSPSTIKWASELCTELLLHLSLRNSLTLIFICLGRQTKQIMVAKFQSLMLLIANAERSPLF